MYLIKKTCSMCKESFPIDDEFWYKDKNQKWGVSGYCKVCFRKKMKQNLNLRKKKTTIGKTSMIINQK